MDVRWSYHPKYRLISWLAFFSKVFVVCKICFWPDCHMFLFTPKVNPRRILDFQKYFRDGILLGSTNSEIRDPGCENPLVCGSEGCFLLANWGKTSRLASGSTAMSKEASKNRRRQHGATNKKAYILVFLGFPEFSVVFHEVSRISLCSFQQIYQQISCMLSRHADDNIACPTGWKLGFGISIPGFPHVLAPNRSL